MIQQGGMKLALTMQTKSVLRAKSMHKLGFDLHRYEKALGAPNDELVKTAAWMTDRVTSEGTGPLRVLVVGPGAGRLELRFLKHLAAKLNGTRKIDACFVDHSSDSIRALKAALAESPLIFQEVRSFGDPRRVEPVACQVLEKDFEKWSPEDEATWDVIVAFFVVSFFDDWVQGLRSLLDLLAPETGLLFLSEDLGDIRYVDNSFAADEETNVEEAQPHWNLIDGDKDARAGDLHTQFKGSRLGDRALYHKFWQTYYELRTEEGYPWGPIVSPARMKPVWNILSRLGRLDARDFRWDTSELSWPDWLALLNPSKPSEQVFHCLSVVPKTLRAHLAKQLGKWLRLKSRLGRTVKLGDVRPRLVAGHRIAAFGQRAPSARQSFDSVAAAELRRCAISTMTSRTAFGIQFGEETGPAGKRRAADAGKTELPRAVFRMTKEEQHQSRSCTAIEAHMRRLGEADVLLPSRGKSAVGVVSWELEDIADPRLGQWVRNVPLLLPPSMETEQELWAFICSYAAYMSLAKYRETVNTELTLLSNLILHTIPAKLAIAFLVGDDPSAELERSSTGRVEALKIGVVKTLAPTDLWPMAQKFVQTVGRKRGLNKFKKQLVGSRFEYPGNSVVPLGPILDLADSFWKDARTRQALMKLFKACQDQSSGLRAKIEVALKEAVASDSRLRSLDPEKDVPRLAMSLSLVAYANTIIGAGTDFAWESARFIPARTSVHPEPSDASRAWEVSLLGYIWYRGGPLPKGLSVERHKLAQDVLSVKANIGGLEDSVQQYVKLVRDGAIRSAIATIMARNMSHNIGSHVLARLGSAASGVRGSHFPRYLAQRMDFIAQISTEWPVWTQPAWLAGDLVRWFLTQDVLLENIGASEGLRAHRYLRPASRSSRPRTDGRGEIRLHVFLVPSRAWMSSLPRKSDRTLEGRIKEIREACCGTPEDRISSSSQDGRCGAECPCIVLHTPRTGQERLCTTEDVLLGIPGGVVGWHAFFVMLENIIRNGAKHGIGRGTQKAGAGLDIVIEVHRDEKAELRVPYGELQARSDGRAEAGKGVRWIRIYDSVSTVATGALGQDGVELWGASGKSINELLSFDLIEGGGRIRKGNWGIAEMKIAAGFLQLRPTRELGTGGLRLTGAKKEDGFERAFWQQGEAPMPLIRACESPIGTLGYEFLAFRPTPVGIVAPQGR